MQADLSNTQIIKNYVAMPDKPQFCAFDIAAATGVNIKTARNTLSVLANKGYLMKVPSKVSGRAYYRQATVKEAQKRQKEWIAKTGTEKLQQRVLKSMKAGVWYSSRRLRIDLGTAEIAFEFLSEMADKGLIEKRERKSGGGAFSSYYWRKDAKS